MGTEIKTLMMSCEKLGCPLYLHILLFLVIINFQAVYIIRYVIFQIINHFQKCAFKSCIINHFLNMKYNWHFVLSTFKYYVCLS